MTTAAARCHLSAPHTATTPDPRGWWERAAGAVGGAAAAAAGRRRDVRWRTVHKDVRIVLRWRQPGTAAARLAVTSSA